MIDVNKTGDGSLKKSQGIFGWFLWFLYTQKLEKVLYSDARKEPLNGGALTKMFPFCGNNQKIVKTK